MVSNPGIEISEGYSLKPFIDKTFQMGNFNERMRVESSVLYDDSKAAGLCSCHLTSGLFHQPVY